MSKNLPLHSLNVSELQLIRSNNLILSDVSFKVNSGEVLLLRGANGVGKTSLLMALAGYLHISDGLINWQQKEKTEKSIYENMHFIAHQHAIKSFLTLRENLSFWADIYCGNKNNINNILEQVGLIAGENLEAGLLSQGQKKRLALARLLIAKKPIWLLDEPTAALDNEGDELVGQMVDNHLDNGGLAIIATHLDLVLKKNKRVKTLNLKGKK